MRIIPTALALAVLRSSSLASAFFARASASASTSRPAFASRKMTATASGESTSPTEDAAAAAKERTFEESSASYRDLVAKLRSVTQLKRAQAVLSYDQMVFMPHSDRTSAARGAQLAALAGVIHEKATDASIRTLLDGADADLAAFDGAATGDERRILELTREDYEKNERVSPELEARKAELSARAHSAWVKARKEDDFESFRPVLEECFDTAAEVAAAQRGEGGTTPLYTQMLDEFERGMPADRIDEIFGTIQDALVPLLSRVLASESQPSTAPLEGKFPIKAQEDLSRRIVTSLGFDVEHGRIDVSVHPFTTSFSPADVRITSRFREDEWYQGLAGTVHEGGHAMYEQNLGGGESSDSGLDVDNYLSMGCHESQSLFWERHVGLGRPFWRWAAPMLREAFGEEDGGFDYSPEELYGAVNAVSPGTIRVEADELTYPLHVILRYKIERDVVGGRLDVADVPGRWNGLMKEMLDVDVPTDAEGCLQDVHWSALAIGYFPTYLLGSATAAQLAHYCRKDLPDFDDMVERGEFGKVKEWLTDKVHRHGRRYRSLDALLEDQLGERLNPDYFIRYLTEKYSELYKC